MRSLIVITMMILFLHAKSEVAIIPKPVSIIESQQFFPLLESVIISMDDTLSMQEATVFNSFLYKTCGYKLQTQNNKYAPIRNAIHLDLISDSSEAYSLNVNGFGIQIKGGKAGIFYGLMSVWQALQRDPAGRWIVPGMQVEDKPRFSWRGMHLDCSRHFFSVDEVKKYLDYLAIYKLNTFHWHLTDDQGWRIEIKKYPLLTTIGSVRKETMLQKNFLPYKGDGIPVKGFYTQDQVKDIIRYAAERHIEVIPEIEMPGHSTAAVSAYPILSCSQKKVSVMTKWGVSEEVFCTRDTVINFLKNVLDEVAGLFPSQYIHIGGDEVVKTSWESCSHCQLKMKELGMQDENNLQSYFIRQINEFLRSRSKVLIGWDEIMEGGLADSAVVMSWRSTQAGIDAAKLGAKVVFCPTDYFYFDHYQGLPDMEPLAIGGLNRLEKVYSFRFPMDSLSMEFKQNIIGAQGNVWTEYIKDFSSVEYMSMPRMSALAELVWTPENMLSYSSFASRLVDHLQLLQQWRVNYSKSGFNPIYQSFSNPGGAGIVLRTELPVDYIAYSLDGTTVTELSNTYTDSFYIEEDGMLQACSYINGMAVSKVLKRKLSHSIVTNKWIAFEIQPDLPEKSKGIQKDESAKMLVNGIVGGLPYCKYDYVGFKGTDLRATVDLGDVHEISEASFAFYQDTINAIYFPVMIQMELSSDRKSWSNPYVLNQGAIEKGNGLVSFPINYKKARYLKIWIKNRTNVPEWSALAGRKAWLLISEIGIK